MVSSNRTAAQIPDHLSIKFGQWKSLEQLRFDNIYADLPPVFYFRHQPEPLHNQFPIHFNNSVAEQIGLNPDQGKRGDFLDLITGIKTLQGTDPLAMCYAGHQFGQYVPRLGDGRALLLGQVITADERHWDLQLKGSGRTLYSRQGDGKAVLRSTIREYLCSAAMHGLGIPTTHALTLFGSDEEVHREQIETGAMILRIAPSHIRFGTFEYFFYQNRYDDLARLGQFTLDNYFPDLVKDEDPFAGMLAAIVKSTAELIANWQSVGFCHGVMNSDNMSVHGITIDYGPYGFLDKYNAGHICNHSDYEGRYAFDQQPRIGLFNLSCLAQAMLPLLADEPEQAVNTATAELEKYESLFEQAYMDLKCKKLGLKSINPDVGQLYDELLVLMEDNQADFTNTFRLLSELDPVRSSVIDSFRLESGFEGWFDRYLKRLQAEGEDDQVRSRNMKSTNPKYILRNYMAETAITLARDQQDFSEIENLMTLLMCPYDEQPGNQQYSKVPPEWSEDLSVSCSS